MENQNEVEQILTPEETTAQPEQTPTPEILRTPEAPKEEKRGRHKKTCTCDKCKAKNGTQTPAEETPSALKPLSNTKVTDSNPLDLSEFKTNSAPITPQTQNQGEVNAGKYITGGMLLILIDALAPAVIVKIFHYVSPKTRGALKAKAVKMSDDQLEAIEPIANEAMKEVFLQMKPSQALIFAIFATYAGNALTAFADIPDLVKPEKATKNV
jgi:hypothetical protein